MSVLVKDYFRTRLKIMKIGISADDIDSLLIIKGIDGESDFSVFSNDEKKDIEISYLSLILDLLVHPNISEDDYSISFNKDALEDWYRAECSRLGVENEIDKGSGIIRDMSFLA